MSQFPKIRLVSYIVPMFGNKHANPYGRVMVTDGETSRFAKFELSEYPCGTISFKSKKYRIRNTGNLYAPALKIV